MTLRLDEGRSRGEASAPLWLTSSCVDTRSHSAHPPPQTPGHNPRVLLSRLI